MKTTINPTVMPDIKQVNSYQDVDQALLALGKIDATLQEREARLNDALQQLRAEFDIKTAELRQQKEVLESQIERFVIANKNDFEKERSRELTHGVIGLRWSPPKIAILNRKYNFKSALEILKSVKWGKKFVRVKEEIDKDALLAARAADEIDDSKLAAVGLKIDSTENFFYTVNWDNLQ